MSDFFKWRPETGLEPWYETDPHHPRRLVPVAPSGRRALWILMAGMASAIPLVLLLLALLDPHYLVVLVVILSVEFGFPTWFLWKIRGRVREIG
ncbi:MULTISPECIES: hypothetical protein [unclassified Shinella]|uniref:hypothetical protein n=1 Tax=unclassified Shinella TaxID=2643062 RepID=UPI00234E389D|nr:MULTISPECIES: hypothetical protein [unclassified Shinella]MCO5139962.1 hypothetical protein [Shinella sp.]MDC7257022.1 hypothetical protein [Shinella sp. YE25]